MPRHFREIATQRTSSTVTIDVFDAGWARRAAESVVPDFRFPVRKNARVSMGLDDVKGSGDSKAGFQAVATTCYVLDIASLARIQSSMETCYTS